MVTFSGRALYALAFLQALVVGSPLPPTDVPSYFKREPWTRRSISTIKCQRELGATLSAGAAIFGPESPSFSNTTHRWNTAAPPEIELVVQAGAESDVSKIVKYCNDNSIKFLAVNRGHGWSSALGKFKGIQIDMKKLTGITIHKDTETATFQGGVWGSLVMNTLWDAGYLTPTGAHACVGFMGPALGGGHGRLEGLHGLVADNMLHLNVVLADGSTIAVNSTSNADLFWAMKGAGHNFGIVTSLKVKIYPALHPTWHWHNYIWAEDKLERVFTELNKIQDNGKAPVLLGSSFGSIALNKSISTTKPVLSWQFAYYGSAKDGEEVLRPFNEIEAIWNGQGDLPYPEIVIPQLTSLNECASGAYAFSGLLTQTWNITTERRNYNKFVKNAAAFPELAATAQLFYEGYATAGMSAVPSDSTAYAHRDEYHLPLFMGVVPKGQSMRRGQAWAKEHLDEWTAGQPTRKLATYINYSVGAEYESLQSVYGYEPWRLERLRKLKAKYDPKNRFRYYVPIIPKDR
ncbi:hypothetical protein BKA66DRAFT_89405 [Pyrenochaeta sp. MPI-SDFR-AT-0127]|nr:hypothetical protein BKA66DRAFT_89405 [Pyrenochaeta sp. MPI-SDFR-AT-0127]